MAVARSRQLTAAAAPRVRAASRADGAGESGLTQLLWVNALHMAGDAMIAVSLAGTLFFAATTDAQRGNVALYLLVTMAPFAVLAPVIGPALDRLQRGRRWAIAASHFGRAVLALVMMSHFDDLLALPRGPRRPRAVEVAQRAAGRGGPARAAVRDVPDVGQRAAVGVRPGHGRGRRRDRPPGSPRCSASTGSSARPPLVFLTAGVLAVRLPRHVDVPTGELQADVFTTAEIPVGRGRRRRVSPHVVLALRANAALRGLGGFLTIFSAFLVQATFEGGWEATLALGAIAAAAGVGSFAGTAAGSRLHAAEPDRLVLFSAASAAAITVLAAVFYSFAMAAVVALVAAVTNALGKVSLDAIIQREVPESLRASAFARSETMLQLAWVVGGAFGIALPPIGWLGFTVAAALLVLAVGLIVWSLYRAPRGFVSQGVSPDAPTTPVEQQWS